MKKKWYLFSCIVFMVTFTACSNDDNPDSPYSPIGQKIALSTVKTEDDVAGPYFVLDNGETMWPYSSLVPYDKLKNGQRILGNYTFLNGSRDNFDYFIRLNGFSVVPLQNIINLNNYNEDSIGNSPVALQTLWVSADYMNVRFFINQPQAQEPIINLVINRLVPLIEDGYGHLELRYNNNGSTGQLVPGLVSFCLGDYAPEGSSLLGLKVLANTQQARDMLITIPYPINEDENIPEFTVEDIQ